MRLVRLGPVFGERDGRIRLPRPHVRSHAGALVKISTVAGVVRTSTALRASVYGTL